MCNCTNIRTLLLILEKILIMLKRNLALILIIISTLISVFNYDFSSNIGSIDFILFISAIVIIIAALILIYRDESKTKN
jgi:hypothetical protein